MNLCFECTHLFHIESLRFGSFVLKNDLLELIESDEDGCRFCHLIWTRIQQDPGCHEDDISAHLRLLREEHEHLRKPDVPVTLRMQFDELENDEDRRLCYGRRFSSCSIGVSTGPVPGGSEDELLNPKIETELAVFAEIGTLAARYIRGRYFASSLDFVHVMSWTKQRLSECAAYHKDCAAALDQEMPTRVIDLGNGANADYVPRVLETRGRSGKYMALSYCWGDGVKHQVKLKKATYADMLQGFEEGRLTKSHQEALTIARELGYQYVWIDALCIIQDDTADWETESARMTECYQNASLTLVAGRSGDSSKGFIANTFTPAVEPLRFEYTHPDRSGQVGDWNVCLPRSIDTGPVEERAWCFQEDILSKRSLIFGTEQLFFQCQERLYHESGIVVNEKIAPDPRPRFSELSRFVSSSDDQQAGKRMVLLRWYGILDRYTQRTMFEPHDIFAALMGLAKGIQRALGSRYLAGLWEEDLIRGLLWQGCDDTFPNSGYPPLQRPKERNPKKPDRLGLPAVRAPSWSWASVEGPVIQSTSQTQELDQALFSAENTCVRPLHDQPRSWTLQTDVGVSRAFMPQCELQLLGVPREVECSTKPMADDLKRDTSWRFAGARVAKFAALTDVTRPDAVVGMGLFDIEQEKSHTLWCMRLIKDRGLMLRLGQDGKYRRLGKFVVLRPSFFENGPEREVLLV